MNKYIKNIKKAVRIALYEMKITIFSGKFLLLSAMSWVFMDMFVRAMRQFALDYNLKMTPATLPFYFTDIVYCNIAFLMLIFLLSDVPFKDNSQKMLLPRCGCSIYGSGQMLAIIGITAIFVLEQFLFSVLTLLPCLEFSGWGKVWGSQASGAMFQLGYSGISSVSQSVLATYTPWQAIAISSVLFWLTGISYGMLEFFLNGISNGKLGTLLLSGWSLIWIFLQGAGIHKLVRSLLRFSPQTWNDLSGKDFSEMLRIGGCILMFLVIFFIVNWQAVKKRIVIIA